MFHGEKNFFSEPCSKLIDDQTGEENTQAVATTSSAIFPGEQPVTVPVDLNKLSHARMESIPSTSRDVYAGDDSNKCLSFLSVKGVKTVMYWFAISGDSVLWIKRLPAIFLRHMV